MLLNETLSFEARNLMAFEWRRITSLQAPNLVSLDSVSFDVEIRVSVTWIRQNGQRLSRSRALSEQDSKPAWLNDGTVSEESHNVYAQNLY